MHISACSACAILRYGFVALLAPFRVSLATNKGKMSSYPICLSCKANYAQSFDTQYCAACISCHHYQLANNMSIGNIVCSVCSCNAANYLCLCSFPLLHFCNVCAPKHTSQGPNDAHIIQPSTLRAMISNREDFERHKKRVYRIRDIQGGLKVWCLTAVERAKFDFNASMREIQSALDELSRRTTEAFAASEKKVNSLFERLEEMKTDYYLRSETFVDEFVVCEGALSGFERMIMHEARSVETVKTMLLEVFAYTDAIQEVKFERGSTPLIFAQINSGASMNYQSNAQIRSGQQAYQPMAEEYKLLSQTGGAEYNQYQANSYGQNSLVGGYSGGSTTVTTYQCSYCKTAFVYSAAYQQRGDGFFLCSQQCKARFEAAYSQSTCTQCKGPIQDKTWWNTGKQQYPGYTENFQFFCSLRCFSGYVPIMPKPVEKKSCAWCEVEVVAKSLLDTSVVQLPCLHMFHDIDCVINYFTACSDNFQMRIDFVCPKCSLQIPSDIVETAVKLRNKKERTVDRLCEKCHIEQFKQVFECGHKLCNNCIKTKEKTFLTILYSTREVCPICGRKERNTLNVHSLKK